MRVVWLGFVAFMAVGQAALAQESPAPAPVAQSVPRVIRFSGVAVDREGHLLTGPISITFALYDTPDGATPLWVQTGGVTLDAQGRYSVLLGTEGDGLPLEAFTSTTAKWIGVQPSGQPELPRVQLLSVPYALKAGDADTLGGKPLSAFRLFDGDAGGSGALQTTAKTTTTRDGPKTQVVGDNLEVDFAAGIGLRLNGPSNHLAFQDSAEPGTNWWYIYRNGGDGRLRFYHSGADRAVFSPEGFLGLGTYAPIGALHINAASNHITLQDSAESVAGSWFLYRNGGDGRLKFYRGGADRVVFDGAGHVGIGTNTPIGQLQIAAAANHLVFQDTGEAGTNFWFQYAQGGDGKLHFWKNGFDRMVLGPTGNVSIGAVTPTAARLDARVDVEASSGQPVASFVNADTRSVGAAVHGETFTGFGNFGAAGISGWTSGTGGTAGYFQATNPGNSGDVILAFNYGLGRAGAFIEDNAASTSAAVFAVTYGTGPTLKAIHNGSSGNIAEFSSGGPFSNVARIDKAGKGFFDGGTQTGGADLAEAFAVDGDPSSYEPGDVLEISQDHDRQLRKASTAYSTRVVGVYATKPGVLLTDLGIDADPATRVPLGVVGVIPTKVSTENGGIHRGDLLVAAVTPGHAMKAGPTPPVGSVIGKALADFTADGTGRILVLVNVR